MNPLYQQYGGGTSAPVAQNMMQLYQNTVAGAQRMMQAYQNPLQFVFEVFNQVPQQYRNDPDQVTNYLLQNNMLNDQQIQMLRFVKSAPLKRGF